ncbi:hypothetical protein [Cereibacter azotoformans]|uniref:hypothetical protein n=1 Tax=Cereibacter azotoformans TaxID=43057 RepID=UPI000C6CE3CA|nr:hypothetical protein [Cereibacter azotoformans]
MSLTVPKAGTIAGRSASVRIEAPQTGQALSQLGERMLQKGIEIRREQLQRQGQQIQLDMTRDLGQARQQIEQTSDPDSMGPAWDRAVADVKSRYITDDIDPNLRQGLELSLQELGDRHALAIGNRSIGLRQSQREADWVTTRARITTEAATADPDTLSAYLEQADGRIQQRLAAGIITPEDAAKERLALRSDVASARATRQISDDPAAFLAAADAGEYDALGGETLASRRAVAQAEIDRRTAAAQKTAEIATRERTAAISKRLKEMTDLMLQGNAVTDEAFLADPEVQANADFGAAAAAQQLRNELPSIRQMTVPQLDAQIALEEKRPKTYKYQVERLQVLRQWRDSAAERWNSQPVETARKAGLPVGRVPEFDPADPAPFEAAMRSRLALDGAVTQEGYTRAAAIVDADEAAQLKTVVDPKAPVEPKVALARSIWNVTSGAGLPRVTAAIGADPVFRRAVRTIGQTGSDGLATEILTGQQRQKLGTVNMPTAGNMRTVFDQVTQGAFDASPAQKAELLEAAGALYANSAPETLDGADSALSFLDDDDAVERFTTAVQRVAGATPDQNGRMTIGGVQEIRDAYVSLPPGVGADDVESALGDLDRHLRGQRRTEQGWDSSGGAAAPDLLRAFRAASGDGSVPALGQNPRARFQTLQLRRVGESEIYEFVYSQNGRTYAVPADGDPAGRAWRFRLPDLIREAGR